jgi:hypothetical protein
VSRLRGARTTLPPRFDSKILGRFERLSGLLSTYRPKLRAGGEVFGQLRPRTAPYPALNACLRDVGTRKKTRRRDQTRRVLTKGQDIDRPATRRGAVRIDATRSASLETERGLLAWEARSSFGLPAAGEESQKGFAAATRGVRRGRQRGIAARSIEALISEQAPGLGSPERLRLWIRSRESFSRESSASVAEECEANDQLTTLLLLRLRLRSREKESARSTGQEARALPTGFVAGIRLLSLRRGTVQGKLYGTVKPASCGKKRRPPFLARRRTVAVLIPGGT